MGRPQPQPESHFKEPRYIMITSLLYATFASEDVDQTRRAFRDLFALPSKV